MCAEVSTCPPASPGPLPWTWEMGQTDLSFPFDVIPLVQINKLQPREGESVPKVTQQEEVESPRWQD